MATLKSVDMEALPDEVLFQILLDLPYEELLTTCQLSSRHRAICQDEYFWDRKLRHDFPDRPINSKIPFRQQYDQAIREDQCFPTQLNPDDSYTIQECVNDASRRGNLARIREYVNRGLYPAKNKYISFSPYEALNRAIESRQWPTVKYLLTIVPLKSEYTSLVGSIPQLAETGQEELTDLALTRAGESAVRPSIIQSLAKGGLVRLLDRYIKLILAPKSKSPGWNIDLNGVLREAYEGAGKGGQMSVLDYLINTYKMPLNEHKGLLKTALYSATYTDQLPFFETVLRRYPNLLNNLEYYGLETRAIDSNAINILDFILSKAPSVQFNNLVSRMVEEYRKEETNQVGRTNGKPYLLIPLVNVLIKHGYNDWPELVRETVPVSPVFFERYKEKIPTGLLLQGGIIWNDGEAIHQALTEDVTAEDLKTALGELLMEPSSHNKPFQTHRITNPAQVRDVLTDLLTYAEDHEINLAVGDLLEMVILNRAYHGADKIPILEQLIRQALTQTLTTQLAIELNQKPPDSEVQNYLISRGANLKLAQKLAEE